MLRFPGGIAVAAAVVVAAVAACGPRGPARQGAPPLAVDVAPAQRHGIATYLSLDGQIAPLQQAMLSTQQSGSVVAVYVNEGQRVRRGQVLAKLDDSMLRAQLAQQQAIVAQARAHLGSSTLQGAVTAPAAQSTVTTAQQQLAGGQEQRRSRRRPRTTTRSSRTIRTSSCSSRATSPKRTFQQARSAYVAAQQALNNAKEQERQADVALRAAQSQGTNAVPIQNQQIASDRATLVQAQAAVKMLQTQIAQTSLIAPFDGVVTQRLLDPGAFASPNAPIVQLAQIDTVYVNVNVPDTNLPYVQKGTPVTLHHIERPGPDLHRHGLRRQRDPDDRDALVSRPDRDAQPGRACCAAGCWSRCACARSIIPTRSSSRAPRSSRTRPERTCSSSSSTAGAAGRRPGGRAVPPPAVRRRRAAGSRPAGRRSVSLRPSSSRCRLGLQTDVEAEVQSPEIHAGTTVITTRPDALQDKGMVAITRVPPGGGCRPLAEQPASGAQ